MTMVLCRSMELRHLGHGGARSIKTLEGLVRRCRLDTRRYPAVKHRKYRSMFDGRLWKSFERTLVYAQRTAVYIVFDDLIDGTRL
jgi:hypothetical protein